MKLLQINETSNNERIEIYRAEGTVKAVEPAVLDVEKHKVLSKLPIKIPKRHANDIVRFVEDVYATSNKFYFPHEGNRAGWKELDARSAKGQFRMAGLPGTAEKGDAISSAEAAMAICQKFNYVDYAGPLAGHAMGVKNFENHQVLVTEDPKYMRPKPGDWSTLKQFFEGLLDDPGSGIKQTPYLYQWIRSSFKNLVEFSQGKSIYRPAEALALCGPRNCGKSLLLELLKTIFGRYENGYLWLSGGSDFNGEMARAELVIIDDEAGLTNAKSRRAMASKIKSSLFGGAVKIHPKNKQAFSARPWWRILFAANDEPESLQVLPLLDKSMEDKIALYKCYSQTIPLNHLSRQERWERYCTELPAFIYYLMYQFEANSNVESSRTGTICWRHCELLSSISSLSPEARLLGLMDEILGDNMPFTKTASEIERKLIESQTASHELRKLLHYQSACGTYLGRLANSHPDRVSQAGKASGGAIRWHIMKPNGGSLKKGEYGE